MRGAQGEAAKADRALTGGHQLRDRLSDCRRVLEPVARAWRHDQDGLVVRMPVDYKPCSFRARVEARGCAYRSSTQRREVWADGPFVHPLDLVLGRRVLLIVWVGGFAELLGADLEPAGRA